MAGGLALLLAKGASKEAPDAEGEEDKADPKEGEEKEAGLDDEFLGDAFDALKSGDRAAFVSAMKSCLEK